jgi:dolichol kinase
MKLIDYVFYRVYSFYKQKKDSTPIGMGCLVLATALFFSLLSLLVVGNVIFKAEIQQYINKPIIVIFLLLTLFIFWKRYSKEQVIASLAEKYGGEEDSKKRRHALYIFLYILVVLLTPMVYGYLKHNLKMDI